MNHNLYAALADGFADARHAPCFYEDGAPDRVITYGVLEEHVARMAGLLRAKGVTPGDRILAQTPKSVAAVALYLATLKIGAVYAPLNTAYTAAETAYFEADAAPALFVRDARALAEEARGHASFMDTVDRSSEDLAALIYTSGTTGRSKGAMLSHGALAANARALIESWAYRRADVLLHALPIFHVHGLFIAMHCALMTGGAMLWLDKFDEDKVLNALPRASVMMGVPTFYTRLLADQRFGAAQAAHMRLFISGSAPLLPSTFAAFEQRTGKRILERYGMSEAAVITTNPLHGARIPGSVGYPLPGVSVRIADGAESGPIEIKGPSLFHGYWMMPDKTAGEFTADGYFKTGDVGRLDPDGRLWISGRAKDLIISGGFNVYPKEIELVLDEMDGVRESAVIGVPHPDFGEAVVAVIEGQGEEDSVIRKARAHLAAFKAPKRVLFVSELPRNAMGKVQKNLLRETYAALFGPS